MGKELRRAQHVVADILTAMTRIIDEDHSVRFKDGHINLIAVFFPIYSRRLAFDCGLFGRAGQCGFGSSC